MTVTAHASLVYWPASVTTSIFMGVAVLDSISGVENWVDVPSRPVPPRLNM